MHEHGVTGIDRLWLVFLDQRLAEEFARQDPYVINGVVTTWSVRPWMVVVGG